MTRRSIIAAGVFVLALALPSVALAGRATSPFAGLWTSVDGDGSSQVLAVSSGSAPSVVYQDFYASGCDTYAGPATHWVSAGQGTIEDDVLLVDFHKSGCGTFLQGGYFDWYVYDGGTDTLTDSWGVVWTR